jgi:L-fuculokinase
MSNDLIAVIDIGKTNAKVSLVDAQSGETTWSIQRSCGTVQRAGIRELDVMEIEYLVLASLTGAPGKERVRSIVPVAHGAAAVLVSKSGEILAAPDYEDSAFGTVDESYRRLRDPFEFTFSPFLPLGLNLGHQLYYLQQTHPELFEPCAAILLYPQYWAWRLSNVMATEITSLGCHTDLWRPRESDYSALAKSQGWDKLLPPRHAAADVLGNVSTPVSRITGIDPTCKVLCGIHDSNASYLCYRASRPPEEHFAVVSSGTWTVVMAHGTELDQLKENRDMLANIDAFGSPVATARFMGGREYEAIAGKTRTIRAPALGSLKDVLARHAMALPSFAGTGGPFVGQRGKLINAEELTQDQRGALATLYCALHTDLLLEFLGAPSPVIIDGPLATNPLFGKVLATLRNQSQVLAGDNRAGPAECARFLLGHTPTSQLTEIAPLNLPELEDYRAQWRENAATPKPSPASRQN